jgi:3-methylcrotonyl-CoA carboxylase beta subunit
LKDALLLLIVEPLRVIVTSTILKESTEMTLSRSSRQALLLGRQLGRQSSRSQISSQKRAVANLTPPHQANAISRIQTVVDPSSEEFKENEKQMSEVMSRMQELARKIQKGGSEKARQKHLERKKMLPSDRVTALIDPGTTFMELSPMAGYDLYPEAEVPAGGIITGVGVVEGVTCVIVANDSTVKGGTYYPITVKKHLRAQAVARENKLP